MPKSRTYQTEAFIIKKTRLGEADRILTLYTPEMGKIQGVAKGVRRPKSKLSGHLELLTHATVSLAHGRNLDTIVGSQTIDGFFPLKNDLELGACALYATELVSHFATERQESRSLFGLLLEMLRRLSQTRPAPFFRRVENEKHPGTAELLRYYETHLLEEVGYRPQLQSCVACRQPLPAATSYFSAAAGGVLCPACRTRYSFTYPLSGGALDALRVLQDGDWTAPGQVRCDAAVRREMETVMRHYIRYLLEREVRSIAWLETVKHLE